MRNTSRVFVVAVFVAALVVLSTASSTLRAWAPGIGTQRQALPSGALHGAATALHQQEPGQQPGQQDPGQPPARPDGAPAGQGQQPGQPGTGDPGQAQPGQAGQPGQTGQPQRPTFRTGVNFVRVDAIVTGRDGKPVSDLKQSDFEVTEDGKPQTIETFRFISVTGNTDTGDTPKAIRSDYDEESEAARDDVRLFTIFLDDYHVRKSSAMSVRKALVDFMQKDVGPADMVGLMYPLQPVGSIRMTRDHDAIISAIEKFEGRKYDYRPRNDLEEKYAMYPAAVVEQIRNQVSLSAIEALSMHLGSLREGRKAIILVSEGYSNVLPPQLNDPIASMPGIGNPNRNNPNAINDDRAMFFGNLDLLTDIREVYNQANRNNTTIYALDPRGLAPFEFDVNEGVGVQEDKKYLDASLDTLRVLADQTDGRAIVNRNDLEGGLKQMVRDSSAYYLIGYSSSKAPADGKFHEIKVRIRRPGVEVRARRGYWALTAEEMANSTASSAKPSAPPAVTKALGSIEQTRRARFIRSWIGTSRGDNGKTRVTFVWEPLPPVPGQDRNQASSVSIIATGSGDRPYFRGRVPAAAAVSAATPPAPAASPAAAAAPVDGQPSPATARTAASAAEGTRQPGRVTFDADPGSLQVRISVLGGRGDETIDTDVREYKVPDLTAPVAAISTPEVFRTSNAREFKDLLAAADPVPTAGREFRRTERLLIRFEAYGPGNSVPEVTARVLNRGGKAMADLQPKAPAGTSRSYQLDLPLAGFASGEYLVEIKAKGPEGEAQELVPLRVTS